MNVITPDIPLLLAGFILLVWAKIFRNEQYFQMLCQFLSTFAAQYSFGLSWSLARLVPIFSAFGALKKRSISLKEYLPFVAYVLVSSLIGSLLWNIPPSVKYWYGEGRVYLQLFNFFMLAASSVALASAIFQREGTRLLVFFLELAAVIHGIASVYQLIASVAHLPLIGISRAHGLTAGETGDVAIFVSGSGGEIIRPGGLMGEPKSAAVLFGIVLLYGIFIRAPKHSSHASNILRISALVLSLIGFFAAFSTSAFLGFILAFIVCLLFIVSRSDRIRIIIRISFTLAMIIIGWYSFYGGDIDALLNVLSQRTTGRFDDAMDAPVQASINSMIDSPLIAIFGVGQGGSSFIVMEFLNMPFDYAYAPNIGFILLLVEAGLIGTILFLGPFIAQVVRAGSSSLVKNDYETRALFIVGVSAMALCLAGSGIPLGMSLAVACIAVASHRVRLFRRSSNI